MARLQSFAAVLLVLAVTFQAASAQTCELTTADVRTGDYSQVAVKCVSWPVHTSLLHE